MDKKIAIFEEIDTVCLPIIKKHVEEGDTVYFHGISKYMADNDEIKGHMEKGRMIKLSDYGCNYSLLLEAWGYNYRVFEEIFQKDYSKNESIKKMIKLYGYDGLLNTYKKEVFEKVKEYHEFIFMVNKLVTDFRGSKTILYLSEKGQIELKNKIEYTKKITDNKVEIRTIKTILNRLKKGIEKIGYLFYPWYLFFKKIRIIPGKQHRKSFKVGITVDQPKGMFEKRYYGDNILVHEKELPKKDVLFIDETKKTETGKYEKEGYNYTSIRNQREFVSFGLLKRITLEFFPVWLKTIPCITEEPMILRTTCKIMSDYIIWNIFTDNYSIKNYVRRLIPDPIQKIEILRKNGVKTWLYYPDASTIDHSEWEKNPEPLFDFMDYEYVVVYGDRTKRFVQSYENNVKTIIKNGILYSQLSVELEQGKLKTNIDKYLKEKDIKKGTKMVGVFDTTFSNVTPLSKNEGIKFGKDILKLLEECPDIFILFKVKYPWEELCEGIQKEYIKLATHPRCLMFSNRDNNWSSSAEVIAYSEFVISASYTSTTMEALGARKRAIYYDVIGKDIGEKYINNRFPNFVAHDYNELKKLVRYWLYEVKNKEFEEYLDKYVKNEIDSHLDGKALSRLRKMISQ